MANHLRFKVEFVLGVIKVAAVIGFIIFAVVVDCGGVHSKVNRGYLGAHYWHDPGAFKNGFKGFCSVFVNAAFAFGGTELVGLAAAEAADPRKSLPTATKQVFWRITGFYVISLFMVGLILPSNDPDLLGSSGANTKASPFVLAIQMAGVSGLPSVFNAVITISVLSVANSCTFGSTRTMQALAARDMGPKFLMYIDSKGRPIWCIVIQLVFGLLAFVNEATAGSTFFAWLLSLSGLSYFFVWGSICLAHIRFRRGWMVQGHTLDELPFQAQFGVIGSYLGFFLNCIALIATFYYSLFVSRPWTAIIFDSRLMLTTAPRRLPQRHFFLPGIPRRTHRHRALCILEDILQEQGRFLRPGTPDGSVDGYADVRFGPAGGCGRRAEEERLLPGGEERGLIFALGCAVERRFLLGFARSSIGRERSSFIDGRFL